MVDHRDQSDKYKKSLDEVTYDMRCKAKDYPVSCVRYVDVKYAWGD